MHLPCNVFGLSVLWRMGMVLLQVDRGNKSREIQVGNLMLNNGSTYLLEIPFGEEPVGVRRLPLMPVCAFFQDGRA